MEKYPQNVDDCSWITTAHHLVLPFQPPHRVPQNLRCHLSAPTITDSAESSRAVPPCGHRNGHHDSMTGLVGHRVGPLSLIYS